MQISPTHANSLSSYFQGMSAMAGSAAAKANQAAGSETDSFQQLFAQMSQTSKNSRTGSSSGAAARPTATAHPHLHKLGTAISTLISLVK